MLHLARRSQQKKRKKEMKKQKQRKREKKRFKRKREPEGGTPVPSGKALAIQEIRL